MASACSRWEDGSGLWEVGAYFTDPPDGTALALLAAAYGARPFTVSEIPATDWVAHVRRELSPVEAGRFFVYGGHDADRVPEGRVALLIEAAMAFGTGHHGTTQGCLLAFEALLADGLVPGPVADIGAGTAVLAMAAAKVWDDCFDRGLRYRRGGGRGCGGQRRGQRAGAVGSSAWRRRGSIIRGWRRWPRST